MLKTSMQRIYLYVSPEEYADVRAAGAAWDGATKRWYIPEQAAVADFARWVDGDLDEVQFGVSSDQAFVVSATTLCLVCEAEIEVICLYCERGVDEEVGEAIGRVTVSQVWAMDEGLAAQLAPWPFFKRIVGTEAGTFANHCVRCGAVQDDQRLHSEPGDVFFSVAEAEPGSVAFAPLVGRVRMSGDIGFGM